jgi:hypothetical protein
MDAAPTSVAAYTPGPPVDSMAQFYIDAQAIAFAEMAAALIGLQWMMNRLQEPTTIILYTNSSVVYHTLVRGSGLTLRSSTLLQNLCIKQFVNKVNAGHGLVVCWVPSAENLADPLSRSVLAHYQLGQP